MRHPQTAARPGLDLELVPWISGFVPGPPQRGRNPLQLRYASDMQRFTGGLSRKQFLIIVCLFWVYVTLSNCIYAYSMRIGIARVTDVPLYVGWQVRAFQHLLLLPCVLAAFWASLRIQWRPLLIALPMQLILASVFAAIAYPAMTVAHLVVGTEAWDKAHQMSSASEPLLDPYYLSMWMASFVSFLPAYGFGLGLVTGLALYTRFQKSELQLAELGREWSAARLAALRMQLSPHTLFNLLHTIRGHIEWDPKAAQTMVVQLADLLRRLLNAGEKDFTRLTDEVQFVRLYLELQHRRFADRLTVNLPACDQIYAVWVPSLILQPLVENAVIHGLAGHQGPVTVSVTVHAAHQQVTLRVTNTIATNKESGEPGIGLKNVRERLAVQFEGRAKLEAGPHGNQWISEVTLPEIHDSPDRLAGRRTTPLVSR